MYLKVEKGWHSTYNWSWKNQMFTRESRGKVHLSKKDWGGGTGNSGASVLTQGLRLSTEFPPWLPTHRVHFTPHTVVSSEKELPNLKFLMYQNSPFVVGHGFQFHLALDMTTTNMGGGVSFVYTTYWTLQKKKKLLQLYFYRVNCNRFSVLNHFHSPKLRYSSAVPKF